MLLKIRTQKLELKDIVHNKIAMRILNVFKFDDVVIGGQLKVGVGVCPPINEGDKRINGSMLCEGPVVLGGSIRVFRIWQH